MFLLAMLRGITVPLICLLRITHAGRNIASFASGGAEVYYIILFWKPPQSSGW